MNQQRVVVFDLETGGLDPQKHPVIQFAGVAVTWPDWREVDSLEVKVDFNRAAADPEALRVNSYSPEAWAREQVSERQAIDTIAAFLRRHATVEKISAKSGRPYTVARLCGHNAARFDAEFLIAWFKRHSEFLPAAAFEVLDTLQLARWELLEEQLNGLKDLKLGTVCGRLGIDLSGPHDALSDVRATAELARRLSHVPAEASA